MVVMEEEEEEEVETETEEGKKSFVDKEMDQPDDKPKTVQEEEEEEEVEEEIPALSQEEEKKQNLVSMSPMNIVEKKQNLVMDYRAMKPDPAVIPQCKLSFLMISTILMLSPFNSNNSDAVSDQLMRKKKCFRAPASSTTESKASVSNHNRSVSWNNSLNFLLNCVREFGYVERCVEISLRVRHRNLLPRFVFLCQGHQLQVRTQMLKLHPSRISQQNM